MTILEKIKEKHPTLLILGKNPNNKKHILIQDLDYLVYSVTPYNLLRSNSISIHTAVDKNKYFTVKANKIHKNKYNYSAVNYTGDGNKIIISCPHHENFEQTPNHHLRGHGCARCVNDKHALDLTTFIEKSNEIHNNKYNYSNSIYLKGNNKISIICPVHGEFMQLARTHMIGHGCPKCANKYNGYKRHEWIKAFNSKKHAEAKVYIIRFYNEIEIFIKIGITFCEIRRRIIGGSIPYSYEVLKEIKGSPDFVWDKEKELHKLCKPFKYKPLKPFQGQTECFTLECLSLLNL